MSGWQKDKAWSDRFLPEIKRHLGENLMGEPPIAEDMERNTDLIVIGMSSIRVGCRIRKNNYLARYGGEFTIRKGRPSGVKTELTKIVEGWGDYFFYGFSDEHETDLSQWFIGDLNVFRGWFNRQLFLGEVGSLPGAGKDNRDNSSSFQSFRLAELPSNFVIASSFRCDKNNAEALIAAHAEAYPKPA